MNKDLSDLYRCFQRFQQQAANHLGAGFDTNLSEFEFESRFRALSSIAAARVREMLTNGFDETCEQERANILNAPFMQQ